MNPLWLALKASLPPAAIVLAGLALLARPWRRGATLPPSLAPLLGIVVALAYAAGHVAVREWPGLWPADATHRVIHASLLLATAFAAARFLRLPTLARYELSLATRAAAAAMLTLPLIQNHWSAWQSAAWLGALVAAAGLLWWTVETHARRAPAAAPAVLVLTATATSMVTLGAASLSIAMLAVTVAAIAAAVAAAAILRPTIATSGGPAGVIAVTLAALWIVGHFYVSVPPAQTLLVASAPLLAAAAAIALPGRPRWQAIALQSGAALPPLAFAAALGIMAALEDPY